MAEAFGANVSVVVLDRDARKIAYGQRAKAMPPNLEYVLGDASALLPEGEVGDVDVGDLKPRVVALARETLLDFAAPPAGCMARSRHGRGAIVCARAVGAVRSRRARRLARSGLRVQLRLRGLRC